ncbi:MAG: transposase [Rhodomicrobium sp.]
MRTSNPIERSIQQELKRRTQKIRVFPNEASLVRLVSAILVEIDEQGPHPSYPMSISTTPVQIDVHR